MTLGATAHAPANATPIKLGIQGLSKRYGSVDALLPTTLNVRQGEFVTLLGPSGSGKTTLLSLVAGLVEPETGSITLDGRDISHLAPQHRGLGMVFQNYALFPHLSVHENVAFGLHARRVEPASLRERVGRALAMVRLEGFSHRMPRELSGGQQQRVALARALAYEPGLVLMDEPIGALDRNLREEMKAEIARIHRELGTSILYVTHDQEEALVLSDRICLMNQARVEQLGTPQELYFAPHTRFAAEFLGESNLLPASRTANGKVEVPALGAVLDATGASGPAQGLILVRPECIEVTASGAEAPQGSLRMIGNVVQSSFTGALTRLWVDVGQTRLRVLVPTGSPQALAAFAARPTLQLQVLPQHCHFIAT